MIIKHLVILLYIIICIQSADTSVTGKTEIVDANHYYSEQNKQKSYKIQGLELGKPLAVVLKPTDNGVYNNSITLTVSSGGSRKQCKFREFFDLCVLEKMESTEGVLEIKCQSLPCNVQWKLYQTPINALQSSDSVKNLYQLPKNSKRIAISLSCKSVIEKQENEREGIAIIFSNAKFQQIPMSKQYSFILLDQVKQGDYIYFYIPSVYSSCATMKVSKAIDNLGSQIIQDYIRQNIKNVYKIPNIPKGQFRFDISFHTPFAHLQKQVNISVTGVKNGIRSVIRSNILEFNKTFRNYDLSYAIPQIDPNQWTEIQLQLQNTKSVVFVQLVQQNTEKIQVEATEFSFFDLKKGQKLQYQLVPQSNAEEKDAVNITLSDSTKLKTTQAKCKVKPGCQFEIQALQDIKGNIYVGVGKGNVKQALVYDFGNDMSFTHKIRQLQSLYIKKKLEKGKIIQVTINSPNVIVYVSSTKKCQFPSQTCYQKLGNIHRHFLYQSREQGQNEIYFLVKALDTCQFTLTLLTSQTGDVMLKDSQPFVYLFDKQQQQLKFKFIRTEKVDVSFNLISPLNALDLVVSNGKKLEDDEQASISTQGYLKFKPSDAPKNQFTILVRKRDDFKNKFVHFTLIASTKGKMMRLESGITHYETLSKSKGNTVQYIFQFNPDQQFNLNFYSHNTKQQQIKIELELQALAQNSDGKKAKVKDITIDKSSDVLQLNQFASQLCAKVDDDGVCQISIQLKNLMDRQVDIAITLMSHHTILQLKDGIWQSFGLNSIAKSTHFYFFPRNEKEDVGIMYKTTNPLVRLKYRLFYSSDQSINLSQWPFPSQRIQKQVEQAQKKIKPVKHISIGRQKLKQCWPNCVVLISVIDLDHKEQHDGYYSIMATNSIMQIPQKQKIDITIKTQQQKSYLVDLKYALDIEQNIYFYVYHSIGLTNIYANVYSQKNDRVPDEEQADFSLNSQNQIIIPIQKIKQIMKQQQMQEHNNIYLYIVVEALVDSKLSIQFAFRELDDTNQKLLSVDTFELLALKADTDKIYYIPADGQYQIKIMRQNGFPIYNFVLCEKELDDCVQELRENKVEGKQILTKVQTYYVNPCEKCNYIFKISTQDDPAQVIIHIQSEASQIELTENKPIYDFIQKQEQNRYVFYAIRGEEIFVNIHVSQGQIEAELTDFDKINQKRTGKNLISFLIPENGTLSKQQKFTQKKLTNQQKNTLKQLSKNIMKVEYFTKGAKNPLQFQSQGLMSAFGLSDKFIQIHINIKSTNKDTPSLYILTYSSGQREFQLQDGLITDYEVQPNKQSTFYYTSKNPTHIYLSVSMEKANYLKDLSLSFKYCEPKDGIISDQCWVQYKTDSPTVKQKSPHPTKVYLLTTKNNLAITMTYSGDHSQNVRLGINHQQIMILPYDVEFPFILHSQEKVHFLVEIKNPGYIEIVVRKCDESNPSFSYTFDYDSFQKEDFVYSIELNDDPKYKSVQKVKPGTLYMQILNPPDQFSMISVLVRYSETKIKSLQMQPGAPAQQYELQKHIQS